MTPKLGAAIELSTDPLKEHYRDLLMVGALGAAAARGQPGNQGQSGRWARPGALEGVGAGRCLRGREVGPKPRGQPWRGQQAHRTVEEER